jgi:CheY-like chemotaxis protein
MSLIEAANDAETRRETRAPLLATALVSKAGQECGRFKVVNLSARGALISGRPGLAVGDSVELALRLPWTPILRAEAIVVRHHADTGDQPTAALAFRAIADVDREAIDQAVRALLRKARSASVLVIADQEVESCHAFVLTIEDLGYSAVAISTPGEATRLLERSNRFRIMLLDEVFGRNDGGDFLGTLARRFPRLRRVLLSERAGRRAAFPPLGIHSVLATPCTSAEIAAALAPEAKLTNRRGG